MQVHHNVTKINCERLKFSNAKNFHNLNCNNLFLLSKALIAFMAIKHFYLKKVQPIKVWFEKK